MAFTADDLNIVETAIRKLAEGKRVTELRFSDRVVRYESASLSDLIALRDTIRSDIARSAPAGKRRSRVTRLYLAGKGI